MEALELKLQQLQTDLKAHFEKAAEQEKTRGAASEELKTQIAALQKQVDAIDKQLVEKHTQQEPHTFATIMKENEDIQRLVKDHRGTAVIELKGADLAAFEGKTLVTSDAVGAATSGVLQIDRTAGIVTEARRALRIRQLLATRPTTFQVLDFVKVNAPLVKGSPQAEGNDKLENAVTFTTASEKVKTLATWIPATRQILDDFGELSSFLQSSLPYYVNLEEDGQLLTGDGAGENLHSLTHQAQSYDTSLTVDSDGWTKIDIIGRAIQQIVADNEIDPSFVVLNPNDYWGMRLKKDSYGRYLLGDPQVRGDFNLFGLSVVPTNAITVGSFLVGSGSAAASEIRDRMEMRVEISTEHSDYFVKNKVAVRAEKRLALVVYRPNSYVYGSLTQSPA